MRTLWTMLAALLLAWPAAAQEPADEPDEEPSGDETPAEEPAEEPEEAPAEEPPPAEQPAAKPEEEKPKDLALILNTDTQQEVSEKLDAMVTQLIANKEKFGELKRLAVPAVTTKGKKTDLGQYLTDKLVDKLVAQSPFRLIERSKLKSVIEEMKFTDSGLVNSEQVIELGKLSGAEMVCVGEYTEVGQRVEVNARILDATTGDILSSASFSFERASGREVGSVIWRSLLFPGWGQIHRGEKGKGTGIAVVAGVMLVGGALNISLSYYYAGKASDTTVEDDRKWYNDRSDWTYWIGIGCFAGFGVVYIYNIIDALIGKPVAREEAALGSWQRPLFAITPTPDGGATATLGFSF